MTRFTPTPASDMTAEQRELTHRITSGPRGTGGRPFPLEHPDGSLAGPFGPLLESPGLGAAVEAVGRQLRYAGTLSGRVRELAILLVADAERSEYERKLHEPAARRAGALDEEIARIGSPELGSSLSETERAALGLVTGLLRDGDVTDREFEQAAASLGLGSTVELVVLVGYYRMLAGLLRVFGLDSRQEDGR